MDRSSEIKTGVHSRSTLRLDKAAIKQAAVGHWDQLLSCFGVDPALEPGKGGPCPKCGGRDRFSKFPDFPRQEVAIAVAAQRVWLMA